MKEFFEEYKSWKVQLINQYLIDFEKYLNDHNIKDYCGVREDLLECINKTNIIFDSYIDREIWKDLNEEFQDKLKRYMNLERIEPENFMGVEERKFNFYVLILSYLYRKNERIENRVVKRFKELQNKRGEDNE